MFTLERQKLKLVDVNPRKEVHGEAMVLAADLKFELVDSNDVLAEFHPTLRASLYEKGDLVDNVSETATKLRYPEMFEKPVPWHLEQKGMVLSFFGSEKPDAAAKFVFQDVPVDRFALDCKPGGSVAITFRAQVHPDTPSQSGQLCEFIQEQVIVSLAEPAEEKGPPA